MAFVCCPTGDTLRGMSPTSRAARTESFGNPFQEFDASQQQEAGRAPAQDPPTAAAGTGDSNASVAGTAGTRSIALSEFGGSAGVLPGHRDAG